MSTTVDQTFELHRRLLEGLAYRMLGSFAEAQDVVQETFLRWLGADRDGIQTPKAWLVTTCSRIALDVLKSAQARRLEYVGPWLPDPYLSEEGLSPDLQMEVDETVSVALMVTLEKLSPSERAAFLLHDVFGYGFEEIGGILTKSSAACRKLASRARDRVQAEKPRYRVTPGDHRRLLTAFFEAAKSGQLEKLKALLVESVELHTDGGGMALAARKVVVGGERVARFFVKVMSRPLEEGIEIEVVHCWYNGGPGLVIYQNQDPVTALCLNLDPRSRRIRRIFSLRHPEKLEAFRRLYSTPA